MLLFHRLDAECVGTQRCAAAASNPRVQDFCASTERLLLLPGCQASEHTGGPCIRWDNAADNKEADLEHPMFEKHQGELWFKT